MATSRQSARVGVVLVSALASFSWLACSSDDTDMTDAGVKDGSAKADGGDAGKKASDASTKSDAPVACFVGTPTNGLACQQGVRLCTTGNECCTGIWVCDVSTSTWKAIDLGCACTTAAVDGSADPR